ncbi:hypothetical protein QFZ20_000686 [Flavobacterium sp. W4I14]|nr:hypothetical protein [Flavobacterium sp. W4I14]
MQALFGIVSIYQRFFAFSLYFLRNIMLDIFFGGILLFAESFSNAGDDKNPRNKLLHLLFIYRYIQK